jgi:hypothetical protein
MIGEVNPSQEVCSMCNGLEEDLVGMQREFEMITKKDLYHGKEGDEMFFIA